MTTNQYTPQHFREHDVVVTRNRHVFALERYDASGRQWWVRMLITIGDKLQPSSRCKWLEEKAIAERSEHLTEQWHRLIGR